MKCKENFHFLVRLLHPSLFCRIKSTEQSAMKIHKPLPDLYKTRGLRARMVSPIFL